LTPKTVLPTLFLIAVIFAPIGAVLLVASNSVSQITLEYTKCNTATTEFTALPDFDYQLRSSDSGKKINPPEWSSPDGGKTCRIRFHLPADLGSPVFLYYRLTNFYQNHRRYTRSLDTDQLKGKDRSANSLDSGDCKPLAKENDKPIYPCGLIANSMFNDTIGQPVLLNTLGNGETNQTYTFSYSNIAWPGERKKYTDTPKYKPSEVVPPPNWRQIWPEYNETVGFPKLASDEHFQNWMRTAGLPTFTKLYGRNDNEPMREGTYIIDIGMNFPVEQFSGTKAIVISTVAWIGGKNPFLGWSYVATAGLFMFLALAGTLRHVIKPRYVLELCVPVQLWLTRPAQETRRHVSPVMEPAGEAIDIFEHENQSFSRHCMPPVLLVMLFGRFELSWLETGVQRML